MTERQSGNLIVQDSLQQNIAAGIDALRLLKDHFYAAIPPHQRQSKGITWVLQQLSQLLTEACKTPEEIYHLAERLQHNIAPDEMLQGVPIFLMAEYGQANATAVFNFFIQAAISENWAAREFAAGSFRKLIKPHRDQILPWLNKLTGSAQPNVRRFVSETLRPVTDNRWLNDEPETSLAILRQLFKESHPYPRTSVGNNLSDLARRNPARILNIVEELVAGGNENSYWIAYRACRNMVKNDPNRIMDLLAIDEYHYKDRNFYRDKEPGKVPISGSGREYK